ncbi:MAG TPA: hypothetical protein VF453_09590 [Burkholderiaceae bacterium]
MFSGTSHWTPQPNDFSRACWRCEHWCGDSGGIGGCARDIVKDGHIRAASARPETGCAFWVRCPGLDLPVDWTPAGFQRSANHVPIARLEAMRAASREEWRHQDEQRALEAARKAARAAAKQPLDDHFAPAELSLDTCWRIADDLMARQGAFLTRRYAASRCS